MVDGKTVDLGGRRIINPLRRGRDRPALDLAGLHRIQHSPWIRFIPVRCLGSVNVVWIADALSAGYDGILRTARTLIIPSAPKENANGLVDLSIALAYLELAALTLGAGTCWAGLLRAAMLATPDLVESMGLPVGHTWFYPMMIGYPKFKYHRLPMRKAPVIHWK